MSFRKVCLDFFLFLLYPRLSFQPAPIILQVMDSWGFVVLQFNAECVLWPLRGGESVGSIITNKVLTDFRSLQIPNGMVKPADIYKLTSTDFQVWHQGGGVASAQMAAGGFSASPSPSQATSLLVPLQLELWSACSCGRWGPGRSRQTVLSRAPCQRAGICYCRWTRPTTKTLQNLDHISQAALEWIWILRLQHDRIISAGTDPQDRRVQL